MQSMGSQRVRHDGATELNSNQYVKDEGTNPRMRNSTVSNKRRGAEGAGGAHDLKNLPAMQKTLVRFLGQEDLLEKG